MLFIHGNIKLLKNVKKLLKKSVLSLQRLFPSENILMQNFYLRHEKVLFNTCEHFMENTNLRLNLFTTKLVRLISVSYNGHQTFRSTHKIKAKQSFKTN